MIYENISLRSEWANSKGRKQPWSTYAVHQTTLLQWGFFWDCMIIYAYLISTEGWDDKPQMIGLASLLGWMLVSKFLKLIGHYIRYPVDFLLLPVSILFGYLHGLIKAKAMLSLNVVSRNQMAVLAKENGLRSGFLTV